MYGDLKETYQERNPAATWKQKSQTHWDAHSWEPLLHERPHDLGGLRTAQWDNVPSPWFPPGIPEWQFQQVLGHILVKCMWLLGSLMWRQVICEALRSGSTCEANAMWRAPFWWINKGAPSRGPVHVQRVVTGLQPQSLVYYVDKEKKRILWKVSSQGDLIINV